MPLKVDKIEDRRLTGRQAKFLSEESGMAAKKLARMKVSEVIDELRFVIDPQLLTHRKVCGTVVRVNPETGQKEPVPHATVHVEDTDCRMFGFFPQQNPWWWWGWMISCKRETLATVSTDECGRFCVLIPRWDIDYVLRLRRRWVCPPVRPQLNDLLARIPEPRIPIPEPPVFTRPPLIGPAPINGPRPLAAPANVDLGHGDVFEKEMMLGSVLGSRAPMIESQTEVMLGEAGADPFQRPVFEAPMAAPLDGAARKRAVQSLGKDAAKALEAAPLGPFLRCHSVFSLEWSPIIDIPDISFRVTQDIDGDGDEETIYNEGLFQVRWNDNDNSDVELIASTSAKSTPVCGLEEVACQDTPAILVAGRMPLLEAGASPAFHDHETGFAVRPNRPRTGGTVTGAPIDPARAPYARDLQLVGCVHVDDAEYYRVTYSHGDATDVPFTESWTSAADPGVSPTGYVDIAPDIDGWYAIADIEQQLEDHWLLNWRTTRYANGRYDVKLELADGDKNPIGSESEVVPFMVDNVRPSLHFASVSWKQGTDGGELIGLSCPTIGRPDPGQPVELTVTWTTTADHLRSATLTAFGCGAGGTIVKTGGDSEVWHTEAFETGGTWTATYEIPGGALPGAYGMTIGGVGRGFSPAGASGPGVNWFINPAVNWTNSQFRFALIS
ncbi:MAG: hypothetical protein ACRBK7_02150 [Acidimicrobiales bacterium]